MGWVLGDIELLYFRNGGTISKMLLAVRGGGRATALSLCVQAVGGA